MTQLHDDPEVHDRGLQHDLPTLLSRRRALTVFSAVGLGALAAACSSDGGSASSTTSASASSSASAPASSSAVGTEEIPDETAGPYPADTGTPLHGAAVYLWHCDRDGEYSLYGREIANENYLRGVQETDGNGRVTFTSIFPAAYSGRWPHAHFEIYPSLAAATSASNKLRTSQLALPEDICTEVYATSGYEASVGNLAQTSLDRDMVFSDGYSLQLATMSDDVGSGLTATLVIPV